MFTRHLPRIKIVFLILALNTTNLYHGIAQTKGIGLSTLGYSGQIFTPSAYLIGDEKVSVGFSHRDAENTFLLLSKQKARSEWSGFVTIGFLPFVELNVRVTRPNGDNSDNMELGIGDRSYALRVNLLKETEKLPAITFGVHDLFNNATFFNTNYLVASKTIEFRGVEFSGHAGYGFKVQDADGHYLLGIFGGGTIKWKFIEGILEYDADKINIAVKGNFKNKIYLNVGLNGLRNPSGAIYYIF